MKLPLIALLLLLPAYAATITPVPTGGVRINADTTGTNTRSSAITVTLQTNLFAGTLNATNSVNVGRVNEAGIITLRSTNGTYMLTVKYDTDGALLIQPASPDSFDVPALRVKPATTLTMGNIQDWVNGSDLRMSLENDGTLYARRIFAVNDGIPNGDDYVRIQSDDILIHPDLGTNTLLLSAAAHLIRMLQAGATNFYVAESSGYLGGGTNFLGDDGFYHIVTSPPGTVVTNININPTDGFVPYRSNATVYGDSPIERTAATSLQVHNTSSGTDVFLFDSGDTFLLQDGLAEVQKNNVASQVPLTLYGFIADNPYLATVGQQQNSPAVSWSASGWASTPAVSQSMLFGAYVVPAAGTTYATGDWLLRASVSNGTPTTVLSVNSSSGYTGTGQKLLTDDGRYRFPGGLILSNQSFQFGNLTAGTNDLYTVPNGARAIITLAAGTTNGTAGTIRYCVKFGGVYYGLSTGAASVSSSISGLAAVNTSSAFIFEPGDVITTITTQTGVRAFGQAILIATNSYAKTARAVLVSGDNTVYVVPPNYMAINNNAIIPFSGGNFSLAISQLSSSTINFTRTLNGNSMGNMTAASAGVTGNSMPGLVAGDTIVVNSDTTQAGLLAWVTVYEAPLP